MSRSLTFLFTDLEDSTRLWEQHPDAMRAAVARHDALLQDAVARHRGDVVKSTGDGLHGVFVAAADGAYDHAARLLGCAQAMRARLDASRDNPLETAERKQALAQLTAALGESERERWLQEGKRLDLDEAVALALAGAGQRSGV